MLSAKCGMPAGAEEEMKAALVIYDQAAATRPGVQTQRNVAKGYKTLAEVQRVGKRYPEALASARHSLALIQRLLDQDPKNKLWQIDYHMGLILCIDLLDATGDHAMARSETARALRFLQPLAEAPEPSLYDLQDYVLLLVSTPFPELRDDPTALRFAVRAAAMTSRKDAETLDLLARALARSGNAAAGGSNGAGGTRIAAHDQPRRTSAPGSGCYVREPAPIRARFGAVGAHAGPETLNLQRPATNWRARGSPPRSGANRIATTFRWAGDR